MATTTTRLSTDIKRNWNGKFEGFIVTYTEIREKALIKMGKVMMAGGDQDFPGTTWKLRGDVVIIDSTKYAF